VNRVTLQSHSVSTSHCVVVCSATDMKTRTSSKPTLMDKETDFYTTLVFFNRHASFMTLQRDSTCF
jgi:hypothetical protein